MKIVHCIFSFKTGGAETMLVDIVNEQCKLSNVSIIIINNIYDKYLLGKIDSRVDVFFVNRLASSKCFYPIFKLNTKLLKIKPDVVHCHNHNIIPLFLPNIRKKTVLTLHDIGINVKYLKLYKKLFAISNIVQLDLKNRTGLDSIIIYNGISNDKITKRISNSLKESYRIVQISRLNHIKKGQHILIEAIKILIEMGFRNIQLDFIGDGESEEYLRIMVANYNLENHINFLGNKTRDDIYNILKDYDLLIQPSLYEGFGLTVVEGMAAGIPTLVSNIDGPIEIIDNGNYGYFFETGSPESLAAMIKMVLIESDKKNIQLVVEKALNRVSSLYDIKNTALNYLRAY